MKIIHFFGVADFMRTIETWDTNTLTGALVLFDLNLPCESGLDGIRRLRAINRMSGIVTGICSGSDDPTDQRRAAAGGADFFVGKPLDVAAWQEICRSVSDLDLVETAGGVFDLVRRHMKAA
ncbi:MAG: response regulator [Pseudomonadota bacterium]